MWRVAEWLFDGLGIFYLSMALLGIGFSYGVADSIAEADCLSKGFPAATVTWDFSAYCIGIDGAVVDRVEAL